MDAQPSPPLPPEERPAPDPAASGSVPDPQPPHPQPPGTQEDAPPEGGRSEQDGPERNGPAAAAAAPAFRRPVSQRGTLSGRWRALSRLPVIMMVASLLLALGIVQMSFQIGNSVYRSVTWKRDTALTLARVSALKKDVGILQTAERSASDPAYLRELARCQGFVGRAEQVVVATSAPTTPPGESCQPVRLP